MKKSENYENVALAILTTSTFDEASKKAGVSVATIGRYRKDTEFQKVLNKIKEQLFNESMQKAQGYCLESLEVLKVIMNDEMATDSSRVSAARTILELGISANDKKCIIEKIEKLERRILDK